MKCDSPFNTLQYFHVCAGLPPCLGHDLFEGIINYDVAKILKHIIQDEKWLTYSDLNRRLSQFAFQRSDRNNQPCPVTPNSDKLGGLAAQNWCFVRILPVLICDKVIEPADEFWQLFLRLRGIVELICAPQISHSQLAILSFSIDEYLESHHTDTLFPDTLRPKHHYLKHYPYLILQFGPLIRSWTMRFESKHSYFKNCVRHLHNFKNLCHSLAEKHQLLQAYRCAGSFFPSEIEAAKTFPLNIQIYSDDLQDALTDIAATPNDEITFELTYRGTLYKKGQYLVLGASATGLLFGEVLFMIVHENRLYFMVYIHDSVFDPNLHVYAVHPGNNRSPKCFESDKIADYCPLSAYGRRNALLIPLKHAVSCDFL